MRKYGKAYTKYDPLNQRTTKRKMPLDLRRIDHGKKLFENTTEAFLTNERKVKCYECEGTKGVPCHICKGSCGRVRIDDKGMRSFLSCAGCRGSGRNPCRKCKEKGKLWKRDYQTFVWRVIKHSIVLGEKLYISSDRLRPDIDFVVKQVRTYKLAKDAIIAHDRIFLPFATGQPYKCVCSSTGAFPVILPGKHRRVHARQGRHVFKAGKLKGPPLISMLPSLFSSRRVIR